MKDVGLLFRGFWIFCHIVENSEIVKTSTALARELDFEGLEGLVPYIFVIFGELVSGWLREWILSDFGMDFGSILASKIDEKRDRFRE